MEVSSYIDERRGGGGGTYCFNAFSLLNNMHIFILHFKTYKTFLSIKSHIKGYVLLKITHKLDFTMTKLTFLTKLPNMKELKVAGMK